MRNKIAYIVKEKADELIIVNYQSHVVGVLNEHRDKFLNP